ncbi:leucyl/phenylalanyl-tRNA--protein transferase [Leptobacterium flavescens]|uniref:Leucyl/phenylalanyl-tRNA--protein transferase n=1 Tax=Leptobacterium flavescens TaxID=472055 RepID=A0A6P0UN24_9FLAO|nr:leucyl/phenylalanyl-tRNA--protein transferase [Leptobacterium flavescens]NER14575.1 leucyl/phenylalanyl-tRNA--protein transferase [Leptobacterium flavescens]
MYFLTDKLEFPSVENASEEGIVAVGGDLSPERLLLAYQKGIFPWFDEDSIIMWWSPDPRMVLFPEKLRISKSMKQLLRKQEFRVSFNENFKEVITQCSLIEREGQEGTWITKDMIEAYCTLHKMGYAASVEVWKEDELVGGLYGVDLGNGVFCGESMFSKISNTSKIAFIHLVEQGNYRLIDCQIYTPHLQSLGAEEIPRNRFLELLEKS